MSTTGSIEVGDDRAKAPESFVRKIFKTTATYIFLVNLAIFILLGLLSRNQTYWSVTNLKNLANNGSEALLLAVGVAVLMAAGMFDLSLGAALVFATIIGAIVMKALSAGDPNTEALTAEPYVFVIGLLSCIGAGILVGMVNGFFINKLRVNPLIATLGTLGIATGVGYVITGGLDIANVPSEILQILALNSIFGIPANAILALTLTAIVWFLLRFTRFGVNALAMGSNAVAASRAGIKMGRQRLIILASVGVLVGFAAFMDLSRFAATSLAGHANDGLAAVTAAVIGGTALAGGRTSIIGTIWGTLLAVQLLTGLLIIGVPPFYQLIATGLFLVIAVWIDGLRVRARHET